MKLDTILEIEKKYQLVNKQIDRYPYWELFRFELIQQIVKKIDGYGNYVFTAPQSAAGWIGLYIRRIINLIKPSCYYHKPVDYFFASNGRRVFENGYYINTILEDIMQVLPNSLLFEYSTGGSHFCPAKTKHIHYSDRYGMVALLSGNLNHFLKTPRYRKVYETIENELKTPLTEMCDAYGVSVNWSSFFQKMAIWYFEYVSLRRSYGRLLKKTSPKALIVVCYYTMQNMIFIKLAKEMGIPAIELQHGTCGYEHISYNFAEGTKLQCFPDYILTFSEFWNKQARFPIDPKHRIAVGHPYGEKRAGIFQKLKAKDEKKLVLFLSQSGNYGAAFSEIACDLQNLLNTQKYHIIYKMHPAEYNGWKKRYLRLAASNIEVAEKTENLYELFARASFIVAIGSTTALYEGLQFDVSGFVYYKYSSIEFNRLRDEGFIHDFHSAEELYRLLQSEDEQIANPGLWEKDSLNKMQREIEMIGSGRKINSK